ncbi:MAG: GtrA family protein [Pseudomonadota bacterium]
MGRQSSARSRGFLAFALISGTGFLLDVALTMGLVAFGVLPFWASLLGAGAAVSFVYVASRLGVFGDRKIGPKEDYALYLIWQVAALATAAAIVAVLAHALAPLIGARSSGDPLALATGAAKVAVTPVTLTANYLFMRWLTERGSASALTARSESS